MKIWTTTTDQDGGQTAVHCTEAAANAEAVAIVTAWWERFVSADQEPRDHTDWRESYSILCDTIGFMESLSFEEHDISGHPAIAAALAAYHRMAEALRDSQEAACNDETVEIINDGYTLLLAALGQHPAEELAEAAAYERHMQETEC